MYLTYKKKLFLYFFLVFTVFTAVIVLVQRNREKVYKTETLRANLNTYAEVIHNYIKTQPLHPGLNSDSIGQLLSLFPSDLRVTIINPEGKVLFDNTQPGQRELENHLNRPEISSAFVRGNGSTIRFSRTNDQDYYYYARFEPPYFIRVALPYNVDLKDFLKGDNIFMYVIVLLFFIALISLLYLADRFGKAISSLKDFIVSAENNRPDYDKIKFPGTELGEIGQKIIANYKLLEESRNQLTQEKEKLLRHFHYSEEGICIFSPERQKIYANTHFIQYINTLSDEPTFEVSSIFEEPEFKELRIFLKKNTPVNPQSSVLPIYQDKIIKNGKHFAVKLLIFTDNSFEITLNNISSSEKNRLLKQEMTNNIAHELKTPVSSIRGYIETLLEQKNISPDKQKFFLERTYTQVIRLSELIRDVALITKTEEAADLFEKTTVNLRDTVQEVISDLQNPIRDNHISVYNNVEETVEIEGNHTLLYSIFRNLTDNAIHYAGENIIIGIDNYAEDKEFYYFSFHDTGCGVEETHLERIFDRFYRINEGRSRKNGGSGLGLSIVKNAVLFHKGQISAKNRKDGGLEFIFSLRKKLY